MARTGMVGSTLAQTREVLAFGHAKAHMPIPLTDR
jgi:hypothetical protein